MSSYYVILHDDISLQIALLTPIYEDASIPAESVFVNQCIAKYGGTAESFISNLMTDLDLFERFARGDSYEYDSVTGFDFTIEDNKRKFSTYIEVAGQFVNLHPDGTSDYTDIDFTTYDGVGDYTGTLEIPCKNPAGNLFYILADMVTNACTIRFYPTMYGEYHIPAEETSRILDQSEGEQINAVNRVIINSYYSESVPI